MINSERLLIRPIVIADAEEVYSYRSDAETNKFQGWVPSDIEQIEDFIETKVSKEFNISGTWAQLVMLRKDTKEIIGDVGIHFLDDDDMQCEVGCTLALGQHGQGFATEALQQVISYLFDTSNKHRITTSIDPKNLPSIALVERLGFRK